MRTRVNKPSLATVLVLVLTATLLMMASPTAEASTLDTVDSVVLTGVPINSNVTVGVKPGDWMEYNVTYVGAADPPENYPTWFRFHITKVQETIITADLTYEAVNGTISTSSHTYDLKTGVLQLLVVPAGLTYADVFYHEIYGNISIAGTETGTYVGETRTAVHGIFDEIEVYWDKATGIFLESGQVLESNNKTVAQQVMIAATNVWQDQTTAPDQSGLDPIVLYAIVVAVIAIVAITVFFLTQKKKNGK
ncbi:MAG: hypothetical protein O2V44_06060 [Candidatus Bathyarchaeota archaeon]|nr:hypothetical protein [Candidatus Bathyarchaeota archaeon]